MVRCPGCDTVNADDAGACTTCGTAIALACGRCGAGNPPLARFCCGCGTRLEATSDEAPSSLTTPERRQMTVLFCDVVGSTALARRLDPEDWHRVLQRVHAQCADVIAKHHGHVAQYLGDGLLAYFGYPVAADDAARRAVAAGLELSREAAKIEIGAAEGLSVRVGIHTGPVIVSNVGSRRHQESLAIGETPSLAARIQEVVPSGAVVVSQETHHLVKDFFACDGIGTYQLKGFDEPRELYRVVAGRAATTRLEAASAGQLTPLVGRSRELDALNRAWSSASSGRSETLLVQGEAGIGKSRLVHSLKEQLASTSASVLELRCSEHARSSAFYPAIECLQRLTGLKHDDRPERIRERLAALLEPFDLVERQVTVISSLLGVRLSPSETGPAQKLRTELMEALSAWLTLSGKGGPRLVIVEDLHWADPSFLELLGTLVGASDQGSTLALLSARPEFTPPWPASGITTITLRRLSTEETHELVSHVAGGKPLPDEVTDRIVARAEGIPLFLEEMTKAVLESGVLKETAGGYALEGPVRDGAIPATLQDSLMGRLDQLGHGKPIAQLAALLGKEFSYALFEATWRSIPSAPQVNLAEGLERVVGAQLLTRTGERPEAIYQFKHSLLQEAAYLSLLRSARREYHGHAADVLVRQFPGRAELEPELVAHHFAQADKPREASDYWNRAGQRAIASSAYAEAIDHFSSALEQLRALPAEAGRSMLEIDLCSRLGVAFITTRGFASEDVERTYTRAAELCGEIGHEIPLRVLYGTWAVNLVRGDLAATQRMVPIFERFAEGGADAATKLVAHAALGTWAFWRGDYQRSVRHCQAAGELLDERRPKEQHAALLDQHGFEGILYPASYLAWAQAILGDTEAARETWCNASSVADRIGDPYVKVGLYVFGAQMLRELERFTEAAELSNQLLALCKDGGFTLWLAAGTVISGSCKAATGQLDEGIAAIREGMDLYRTIGAKTPYAHYLRCLSEAYLERGDLDLAAEAAREGLSMARANLDKNFEGELLRLLGEALFRRDEVAAAEECFTEALAAFRTQGARLLELRAATSWVRLQLQLGQEPKAAALLREVRSGFGAATELPALRRADAILVQL